MDHPIACQLSRNIFMSGDRSEQMRRKLLQRCSELALYLVFMVVITKLSKQIVNL